MRKLTVVLIGLFCLGLGAIGVHCLYLIGRPAPEAAFRDVLFPISTQDPISAYLLDSQGIGYASVDRKLVIAPVFAEARLFDRGGLARVRYKGKWGVIDRSGNFAINPIYDVLDPFDACGRARAIPDIQTGEVFTIDRDGRRVESRTVPCDAEETDLPRVRAMGDRFGYVNAAGELVIPPDFCAAEDFTDPGLGLVETCDGRKYYINSRGAVVFDAAPAPDMERADGVSARADWRPLLRRETPDNGAVSDATTVP